MTAPAGLTPMQVARLDAVLATKREHHPELRRPLTSGAMRAVLRREKIAIHAMPHPRDAELTVIGGQWVLIINDEQSSPAQLIAGAHEVAHLWAHRDPLFDRSETVFDRSPDWHDVQHEAEADYLAEQLIAGPTKRKQVSAKSKLPHSGKATIPERRATLSAETARQLRFLDDDPDEAMLRAVARSAARDDAKLAPVGHGRVQFALPRAAWNAISLAGTKVPLPHYTNIVTGPDFELVTATIETASLMVELLARAGYKRTAVYVRRTIREAADPYEVREQHRAHVIREGAKRVAAASETWVTKRRMD